MPDEEPIAIVGIGGIFPAAPTLDQLWRNIANGIDAAREVPSGRWILSPEDAFDPALDPPKWDKVYSKQGCFIEDFTLDPTGLELNPNLVAGLDPMFHFALHAGRQAIQEAVTKGLDRSRVGVILGNIVAPNEKSCTLAEHIIGQTLEEKVLERAVNISEDPVNFINRYVTGLPGGVLAKALRLEGGSFTVDAACAASLYAVKLAVDELLEGRADAMLSGGISRPDSLYIQMGFSQLRALSPSGRCASFDHRADGILVGEGAGMFVLKRLEDALRAGDHIYALIRGMGLSNDVGGDLLAPNSEGQLRAMQAAYEQAGWDPQMVDLIECHGTGTPVGDAVEFQSLQTLWGKNGWKLGQCVIGSVKSNVGHLLTGAGAAGLMKVLLALKNKQLPPTANFERPSKRLSMAKSPFQVLSVSKPWERRDQTTPRRAAISGFGFGGINAHLLLEEWAPQKRVVPKRQAKQFPANDPSPIAVVGMEAKFGPWDSLRAFQERVFAEDHQRDTMKPKWWGVEQSRWYKERGDGDIPGYYMREITFPLNKFRIPPNELREILPQQLLMLEVSEGALADAQINSDKKPRTGAFVGVCLDLSTTSCAIRWSLKDKVKRWVNNLNFKLSEQEEEQWLHELSDIVFPDPTASRTVGGLGGIVASRIAREFRIGGPSFTLSSEESSGLVALGIAIRALQRMEIDDALVGAVDLSGDVRSVLGMHSGRPFSRSGTIRPFDRSADGTLPGEGAAAVVLKRLDDAIRDGNKIYAVIKGIGSACSGGVETYIPDGSAYRTALEKAYEESGIDPGCIGYLETHGSGYPGEDRMEMEALCDFFATGKRKFPCAIGSVKADIGHTGAVSGMASFIKACLCLYHEIIPPLRNLNEPTAVLSENTTFFLPRLTQYWLRNCSEGPRRAAVSSFSMDGNCLHVVLESHENGNDSSTHVERLQPVGANEEALFAMEANNGDELKSASERLKDHIKHSSVAIEALARTWWRKEGNDPHKQLGLALVARSQEELLEKIEVGLQKVRQDPLGRTGQVAFVFPGVGNSFPGMGREFALQWPELIRRQESGIKYMRDSFDSKYFWNDETFTQLEVDPMNTMTGQVSFASLICHLIQNFAVKPEAIIGYSLGELTGFLAMNVWKQHDEMNRRIRESILYRKELAGECRTLRKFWKIPKCDSIEPVAGLVDRPKEVLREAIAGRSNIYLLIVCTPNECIIGGEGKSVRRLVRDLGCNFYPVTWNPTIHCEAVQEVKDEYRALHFFKDVSAPEGVRFYNGAWGRSYQVTGDSAADAVLAIALQTVDFPAVIQRAYQDGVRIFVEMGPGDSCSRMIRQILADHPHMACSASVQGRREVSSVLNLLARLIAERVPVDLGNLYGHESLAVGHRESAPPPQSEVVTIPLGGEAFQIPKPKRFRSASVTTDAHQAFLRYSDNISQLMLKNTAFEMNLLDASRKGIDIEGAFLSDLPPTASHSIAFDREACLEFARGSITKVLGPEFAEIDTHPTRVRLPDEPLMLVDRILSVEGEPHSFKSGRVISEHDVLPNAWYLDGGRIPAGIAVEAGQAGQFLVAYLGIDFKTEGMAMYRLLDVEVTAYSQRPGPGTVLRYDFRIKHFFRQEDTYLFRFEYDGYIDGKRAITMRNGCAGLFTAEKLAAGEGIIETDFGQEPIKGAKPADWEEFVPMQVEQYSEEQINALREGRLADCFGPLFEGLSLKDPLRIPGGRLRLVDRVVHLDPEGGLYGIGMIRAEMDIHPDDWFFACHFVDDRVMPGTLMYECCFHALRIYLLRMGWVGEQSEVVYNPVLGLASRLKCRGQVTETTNKVTCEIHIKGLGYRPEPYAIANAFMYADDKRIVKMTDMTILFTGLTREKIQRLWDHKRHAISRDMSPVPCDRKTSH